MKIETYIFGGVAVFLFVIAAIYGVWSGDPTGITALIISGGFCGLIASYFGFIARRIDARPEDRGDGEIAESAGEIGFFSPHSYWPFALGVSAFITAIATSFWAGPIMAIGVVCILASTGGLLFEYYVGQNRT
jgi:hypothetical protein